MKNNILISSAGRRVSLLRDFQHELRSYADHGKIYAIDSNPELSAACQIADGYFKVPPIHDDNFIPSVMNICLEYNIKVVIPTIDTELKKFAENKKMFQHRDIIILVADPWFVDICRDKRLSKVFFNEHKIKTPTEIDINNPIFPFFARPYDGSSSNNISVVHSKEEISQFLLSDEKLIFYEYLPSKKYKEYTIDMYYDQYGILKCVIPRRRILIRGGEVNIALTEKNFLVSYIRERFEKLEGVRGCINIQVFVNKRNNEVIGIEINPRFGGGYPLSYKAGANFPEWIIKEYFQQKSLSYFNQWEDNLLMLRYDDEVLIHGYEPK